MATVSRENIGTLHDRIVVKLSKEDYMPSFEKSLKQYGKQAQVPGFRKGMVPTGMVKKMFGQNIFRDEVLRNAAGKMEDYIGAEKLEILAQPMILPPSAPQMLDMHNPEDAEFAFEIGLKPQVEIPALAGNMPITRYRVDVTDAMVDNEVQRTARRFGKVDDRSEVATKDDVVYLEYLPCDGEGNPIEGAEKREDTTLLENLPAGLQERLMGKEPGTSFTFKPSEVATAEVLPNFMQQHLKAEPMAADFIFQATLTKVGMLIPRDFDILFFSEVFPNDNIADEGAFREKIRGELQKEYNRIAESRLNDEIFEKLVHQTPIHLPHDFLKRWMREGGEKRRSTAEVDRDYPRYDHELRWTLISDKIIRENGITVTREDVKEDVRGRVLTYFGMEAGEEAPWMESYLDKMLKDEKTMNETYQRIMLDRLFGFLRTRFSITEQEVSEEEFFKLPSPHEAQHQH